MHVELLKFNRTRYDIGGIIISGCVGLLLKITLSSRHIIFFQLKNDRKTICYYQTLIYDLGTAVQHHGEISLLLD